MSNDTCRAYIPDSNINDNKYIEIEIGKIINHEGDDHGRFIMISPTNNLNSGLIYRNNSSWQCYFYSSWKTNEVQSSLDLTDARLFEDSVIRVEYGNGKYRFYKDNVLFMECSASNYNYNISIGSDSASFYEVTIKGLKIYEL